MAEDGNVTDARVDEERLATDEELGLALDDLFANVGSLSHEEVPDDKPTVTEEDKPRPTQEEAERLAHEESSRLGRKVAYLDEHMAKKEDLDEIKRMLLDLKKPQVDEYGEHHDDEQIDLNSPEGLAKFLDERDRRKQEEEAKMLREANLEYGRQYVGTMEGLLSNIEDANTRKKIRDEMVKSGGEFNKRYSNSPAADCAKNFSLVVKSLKPTNHFQQENRVPKVPTGTGIKAGSQTGAKINHELDDVAKEYVKKMNMTAEFVNEALEGETPLNLRGRNG
jgi:hypothetical protein